MKIELNISTAMILRKRIKELASNYESVLIGTQYIAEPEKVSEILEKFEDNNVLKTYDMWCTCLNEVTALSNLIDEHNVEGKSLLNVLNTLNLIMDRVNRIITLSNASRTSKTRNPVTGVWEVNKYEKITDTDFSVILDGLKKKKIKIEDDLAKFNANTKFDFELNDDVYHKIYG